MRHIPDGVLRRLDDEPLAVPDRVSDHVAGCESCQARRSEITRDTQHAAALLASPQVVPDLDLAWARVRRELNRPAADMPSRGRRPTPVVPRRARLPQVSLRAGLAMGAVAVVVAGTAAAATLTTIFSPTHVAPVAVTRADLRAIAAFAGLGDTGPLAGLTTPQGSSTMRFGTITWSTAQAQSASSLAQADARAGFAVSLPTHLPAGVGAVQQLTVQPRARVTVTFNSRAGSLAGSSATVDAGPGVVATYSGSSGAGVPTLAVATMRRPTAQSTGASLGQIENFLLDQPGIPPELAEDIRLLGDLRTILPVPVPPGASVRSVRIGGWPGILLADSSGAAAGAVWEDGRGMLHVVIGILDPQDVLNVAKQLG